jgi:SAM-dependent methyltransferase
MNEDYVAVQYDINKRPVTSYPHKLAKRIVEKHKLSPRGKLPYGDNEFDVIYSKSVIEHMLDPLNFVSESFRVLKPGGTLLVLTPDWEANYRTFFDDFTHVRPMSRRSMNLLLSMLDPKTLDIYRFRQLPITWKFPIVNLFCAVISPFIPVNTRKPFFRWSRELMLIGVAVKKY